MADIFYPTYFFETVPKLQDDYYDLVSIELRTDLSSEGQDEDAQYYLNQEVILQVKKKILVTDIKCAVDYLSEDNITLMYDTVAIRYANKKLSERNALSTSYANINLPSPFLSYYNYACPFGGKWVLSDESIDSVNAYEDNVFEHTRIYKASGQKLLLNENFEITNYEFLILKADAHEDSNCYILNNISKTTTNQDEIEDSLTSTTHNYTIDNTINVSSRSKEFALRNIQFEFTNKLPQNSNRIKFPRNNNSSVYVPNNFNFLRDRDSIIIPSSYKIQLNSEEAGDYVFSNDINITIKTINITKVEGT